MPYYTFMIMAGSMGEGADKRLCVAHGTYLSGMGHIIWTKIAAKLDDNNRLIYVDRAPGPRQIGIVEDHFLEVLDLYRQEGRLMEVQKFP